MVAYHFPPVKTSSGIQRTLRFAEYLPEHGWTPLVLAPHARAYPEVSADDIGPGTNGVDAYRAFALDTSMHLSIGGRYPRIAAVPDRWISWWLGAVPAGLKLIRKFRPDIIWSTYPIATAHLIGLTLHRLSGIPWAADFRDPMAQEGYPADPLIWKSFDWIEKRTIRHAAAAIFTTQGALREYTRRYPAQAGHFSAIENGYDEKAFAAAENGLMPIVSSPSAPLTIVHSGTIYPDERDPRAFFTAIAQLRDAGDIDSASVRIVLRATAHDAYLQQLIDDLAIQTIVSLAPPVGYQEALREMLMADGLLILQAANCNEQIPAKLYECLRARRPILGLTDPEGDSGRALRLAGVDTIAPLSSAAAIRTALKSFLALLRRREAPIASEESVKRASRRARTAEFAKLLNEIAAARRPANV